MKIKTTKEILESDFADEYFDIQNDLHISETPKEENIDYIRLKSWYIAYNKKWIAIDDLDLYRELINHYGKVEVWGKNVDEICEMIVNMFKGGKEGGKMGMEM